MWAVTLVVAAAPSLFLLTFFYLRDRYEREPLGHIVGAFLLGMYAMVAAHGMAVAAEGQMSRDWLAQGGEIAKLFDSFVLSGFIEEAAKWVILVAAVYHWDEFDEPLDGVVYGVALALGFATLENVFYVARLGLAVGVQRALFAVPAHALFGAAMGYYAGRAKFDRGRTQIQDRVLCLAAPTVFHGLYNFALHRRLDWKLWSFVAALSIALWAFVIRRVHLAQHASPFKTGQPT